MKVRFRGNGSMMVGAALFNEAGVTWRSLGANEVEIPDDGLGTLDDEQRAELVKLVRDPIVYVDDQGNQVTQIVPDGVMTGTITDEPSSEAVHPPVAADDTSTAVVLVGDPPPRSGQGATREAWAAFAEANSITVTADMSRDQIIEAVEAPRGS